MMSLPSNTTLLLPTEESHKHSTIQSKAEGINWYLQAATNDS
jgi:TPR repeat protein